MSDHHRPPSPERIYELGNVTLTLPDFDADGFILDIGGGGEGIIGILKGEQVVAIDPSGPELAEAAEGPLKIVMDARELKFLDETFNAATAFFTLMYIDAADHGAVFREAYRVLKPGGIWRIWDVTIPEQPAPEKDIFVIRLSAEVGAQTIKTGYGSLWPENAPLDLSYYVGLAECAGFEAISQERTGPTFALTLRRP